MAAPPGLPEDGDVYVLVHTADGAFRVHYDAGTPSWVRREYESGAVAPGFPPSMADGEHAAAIAVAEEFLAPFRAPRKVD